MKNDIIKWFLNGNVGASSKTIAARMCRIKETHPRHPLDPSDFKRCLDFLDAVPDARARLHDMCDVSPQWFRLVTAWEKLEATFREELLRTDGTAPKTYKMMDAIQAR